MLRSDCLSGGRRMAYGENEEMKGHVEVPIVPVGRFWLRPLVRNIVGNFVCQVDTYLRERRGFRETKWYWNLFPSFC